VGGAPGTGIFQTWSCPGEEWSRADRSRMRRTNPTWTGCHASFSPSNAAITAGWGCWLTASTRRPAGLIPHPPMS
jgi:hypothetical protein